VQGSEDESLEDEKVQGALEKIGAFIHAKVSVVARYLDVRQYNVGIVVGCQGIASTSFHGADSTVRFGSAEASPALWGRR
jgi:hypothetical protein